MSERMPFGEAPERYVDADEKGRKSFEQGKEQKTEKSPQSLNTYRDEAQQFLDSYDRFLKTYAKDVSLSYKLSDKFFIDLQRGEVNLATQWFAERGYTKEQILWACLHELEHFRDLANDPEGMKKNFEHIRARGSKTGNQIFEKWEQAYGASDPAFVDKLKSKPSASKRNPRPMSHVEQVGYQIHHTFYNIFDDIFVNNGVRRRASAFADSSGGHGEQARTLYEEKLFPLTEYAEHPRHLQFLYKLLREEMLPDQECVVSEDVAKALEKKIRYGGKTYTPKQIVEELLKPRGGRDTLASRRALVLKRTIEPIFDELLKKDLDDWNPQKPEQPPPPPQKPQKSEKSEPQEGESEQGEGEKGEDRSSEKEKESSQESGEGKEDKENESEASGESTDEEDETDEQEGAGEGAGAGQEQDSKKESGNPFEDFYKKFENSNPDQLDPDQIQEWLDKTERERKEKEEEEGKKDKEENKTTEQRASEAQEKADEKWRKENDVTREQHEEVKNILREIEPYLNELSQLWRHIIFGKSKGYDIAMEGHFRTGSELDIAKVIEEFPQIKRGKLEETRVMRKMTTKETTVDKPELIRLRLLGDVSGSMDENKRHVLKQCTALVLASFQEFEYYLNVSRRKSSTKLHTDTEVWTFHSYEQKIKHFAQELRGANEPAEIVRSIASLNEGGGSTYDNRALEAVKRSLTPEEIVNIKKNKTMEILFEITDGGSSDEYAARNAIDTLSKDGLITRAFQIGSVGSDERRAFNDVWNRDRVEPWGQEVGSNIGNLIPAITAALKKYLGGVQL